MLRELAVHLAALQVTLMLVVAMGWALAQKSAKSLIYGALHGVFANCLAIVGIGVLRPAALPHQIPLDPVFIYKYSIITLVCALVSALGIGIGADRGYRAQGQDRQSTWRPVLATLIYAAIGFLSGLAFFLSRWVAGTFAGVQADQLLFFILGGNPGTTPEQTVDVAVHVLLPLVGTTVGAALVPVLVTGMRKRRGEVPARFLGLPTLPRRWLRRLVTAAMSLLLVGTIAFSFTALPLAGVLRAYFVRSTFIEDNYVEPTAQVLHFPEKPKNLIHIYLESMENSYYSKDEGGYLDKSLMPDLAKLTDENISFSNTDHYGGPLQTMGANHSVAGMLNFHAGVPMIPLYSSSKGGRISYPDFATIGDLLHEHGYQNSFMLGTGSWWHKMGDYYREHGNFDIFDLKTARDRKLVPPDYAVWWGIEDDKLYEYAKDEMTRLAGGDKPFYFILENADTHNNGGYVSPLMTEFPSDKQYGNVIHYSQGEIVKLVRWIQAQPWYEDTVIVLTGDHQSMDNEFFIGWNPDYERTVVNVFINSALPNPGPARTKNRAYAPFDFFPTIMASLGVKIEGDRLGLGTNLYSHQPTLLEKYGFDYINDELSKRNTFYEEHRLDELGREDS